jgi:hypothetical protein
MFLKGKAAYSELGAAMAELASGTVPGSRSHRTISDVPVARIRGLPAPGRLDLYTRKK